MTNGNCVICGRKLENPGAQTCTFHTHGVPVNEFLEAFDRLVTDFRKQYGEWKREGRKRPEPYLDCHGFIFPPIGDSLDGEKFEFPINMGGAEFGTKLTIRNVEFRNWVYFVGTKFAKGATFIDTTFHDVHEEGQLIISANFGRAQFGGDVLWDGDTRFNGACNFQGCRFGGKVDVEAHFNDYVDFTHCTFVGEVAFKNVVIGKYLSLYDSKFYKGITFRNITGREPGTAIYDWEWHPAAVDFSEVKFEEDVVLVLRNVDLSKWAFSNTEGIEDPERVRLIDVTWGKTSRFGWCSDTYGDEEKVRSYRGTTKRIIKFKKTNKPKTDNNKASLLLDSLDRSILFGEIPQICGIERFPGWNPIAEFLKHFDEIKKEYKKKRKSALIRYSKAATKVMLKFRKRYEAQLEYAEAAVFHIREMRYRTTVYRLKGNYFSWLLSSLYGLISNYGEGALSPLVTLFFLIFVFAVPWYFVGVPNITGLEKASFTQATQYSLLTFFSLPNRVGCFGQQLLGIVQRAVGASIITLFILALRRAFRR